MGGSVFGMHSTVVNPPFAAARDPDSMVSLYSKPGSRKCTCMSINPGSTSMFDASIISASLSVMDFAIFSIFPLFMRMSAFSSFLFAGSTIVPFLINNFICFASSHKIQYSHSDCHAVCYLFFYDRLRPIRHIRRYFNTAVHGARVHNKTVAFGAFQFCGIYPEKHGIFPDGGKKVFFHSFKLYPEYIHDICAFDAFFKVMINFNAHFFYVARYQSGRADNAHLGATFFSPQMFERATRECAMSPTRATVRPSILFFLSIIVNMSRSPCVGCSCMPSPAFIICDDIFFVSICGTPDTPCLMTTMSICMASMVRIVSIKVSPLATDEVDIARFNTSAESLLAAISKDVLVLVEFSKKKFATVLPFKVGSFFTWRWFTSLKVFAMVSISVICSGETSCRAIKCFNTILSLPFSEKNFFFTV